MDRLKWFNKKFNFDFPAEMFAVIVERLRNAPSRVEWMTNDLSVEILEWKNGEKWSIKEQIGHLSDLEELHSGRLDDFRQGRNILRPADLVNQKTFDAHHNQSSLSDLINLFKDVRRSFIEELLSLSDDELIQSALHERLGKPMRIVDMAFFVAEHDDHHIASIRDIIELKS